MDKSILSSINFCQYIVESIEFKINSDAVFGDEIDLDIKFNNNIQVDMESNNAIITIETIVFDKYIEKAYPFYLELTVSGFFSFSDMPEVDIRDMLEVNGTAILFPYIRMIVSNITTNSGVPALILPTLNISKMIKKHTETK